MKNGKLEISDVGKKFKIKGMEPHQYFLLLGITSKGDLVGEDYEGNPDFWLPSDGWTPYEEPKQTKRIEAAPAVIRKHFGEYAITPGVGTSADDFGYSGVREVVKWPADFDKEKGVWFYEYEE